MLPPFPGVYSFIHFLMVSVVYTSFVASYNNGQRRTYSGPALERSGSFWESLENRVLSTASSTLRNTSGEIPLLLHYLLIESFSVGERKHSCISELRRVLSVTVEENTFGSVQSKSFPPDALKDLKRSKTNISEMLTKARDLAKLLQDSLLRLDRYRNLISRKRQRTDQSTEKSGNLNSLKIGSPSPSHADYTEIASLKLEDRAKNLIPNKRIRSSLAEGTVLPRPGAAVEKDKTVNFDKDRGMVKGCNGGPVTLDDKIYGLPPGNDGWEKNKRKRSVGLSRIIDGDQELKQSIQ